MKDEDKEERPFRVEDVVNISMSSNEKKISEDIVQELNETISRQDVYVE